MAKKEVRDKIYEDHQKWLDSPATNRKVLGLEKEIENLKKCIANGHDFKAVYSNGYHGEFVCKVCGYKHERVMTWRELMACRLLGLKGH